VAELPAEVEDAGCDPCIQAGIQEQALKANPNAPAAAIDKDFFLISIFTLITFFAGGRTGFYPAFLRARTPLIQFRFVAQGFEIAGRLEVSICKGSSSAAD